VKVRKRNAFVWIGLAFLIATGLAWAFWPAYCLEVSSPDRGEALLSLPASPGDRFSVWFMHSYDLAFFQENYQIDSHYQILLRDMTFKSDLNGAGFVYPHFFLRKDGVGELRDIDELRDPVEFMMGSKDLANHTLLWKGKRIELSEFFEAGDIINIRVVKRKRLTKLIEDLFAAHFEGKNSQKRG
jgi:hypothetical protein